MAESTDTREQGIAQSYDRHIAVTANAGSGKTTVLNKRYVNILFEPSADSELYCEPKEIVAITFTRKAATEIKAKIAKSIEEKIKTNLSGRDLRRLLFIRDHLSNSRITTIHSFCASILRDFPIETGVSPNFTELTETDVINLRSNSIISTMEGWLSEYSLEKRHKARQLFNSLNRKTVEKFLNVLLSKREIAFNLKDFYNLKTDDDILRIRDEELSQILILSLIKILNSLKIIFENLDNSKLKKDDKIKNDSLFNRIQDQISYIKNIPSGLMNNEIMVDVFELINNLISEKILSKSSGVYSNFIKKTKLTVFEDIREEIRINLEVITNYNEISHNLNKDIDLVKLSRILFEMYEDTEEIYEKEKSEIPGMDFDDLLIKTMILLQNKEVCNKVRRKIKYLMIDEFQDTNKIQYEIMRKIVPELDMDVKSEWNNENKINFFIVGDAKQSIYGFRTADVRIFNKAITDIQKSNLKLYEKSGFNPGSFDYQKEKIPAQNETEEKGYIELTASFRHSPVIAAFINDVCRKIFKEKNSDWDVDYSDLVCTQQVDKLGSYLQKNNGIISNEFGTVDFILNINDKKEKNLSEINIKSQEELLSENIYDIVIKRTLGEKIDYGDIAVLSRTKKGFSLLTQAFQKFNIPYILSGGKGFYEVQEIIDIISFLKFLNNPNDNVSLAGILKAPFFDLTNTELFLISRVKNYHTLFERFKRFCDLCRDEKNSTEKYSGVLRAEKILNELIALTPRMTVSMLILKILELTGYYGTVAGTVSQSQVESNINKVLEIARDFEAKGFRSLVDFIRDIDTIIKAEAGESEAVILKGENAVNIMTIHSAKGLQFPVVVLYFSETKMGGSNEIIIDEKLGLTFSVPVTDKNFGVSFRVKTPMLFLAGQSQKEKDSAEEKRIMYVALTRAEKHLIISGSINKPKNGSMTASGFLKLLLQGVDTPLEEIVSGNPFQFESNLGLLYKNGVKKNENVNYSVNVIIDEMYSAIQSRSESAFEHFIIPLNLLDGMQSRIDNEIYSASKIMTFEKNEDEYIKRYLLGIHSEDDEEFIAKTASPEKEDDRIIGTLAGTIIHSVLEKIPKWFDSNGQLKSDILDIYIESAIEGSSRSINANLQERIKKELTEVTSTKLLKKLSANIQTAKPEYFLQMPLNTGFLVSKIDLLIKNEMGDYEIWDWKTNRIINHDYIDKLVKDYEIQMKVYAYFISLLYPEQKQYKARLLFTRLAKSGANEEEWTKLYLWDKAELDKFRFEIESRIYELAKIM